MATHRLFFALLPSPEVREACLRAAKDITLKNGSGGRLTPPEDYHLTVLFLGDQVTPDDEAKARGITHELSGDPVSFTLNHASGFKEAKVWWLGMTEIPGPLIELRTAVKEAASRAGLPSDRRRFAPHVTFLRGTQAVLPQTQIQPIQWHSDELVLIRSRLDLNPRVYEVLERLNLTGARKVRAMEQMPLI